MRDFGDYDNVDGSFPDAEATDSTDPSLRDGTAITADVLNDLWGALQAILEAADVTPSGSIETASTSDFLDSVRLVSGAPGEIVLTAFRPQSITGIRLLELTGQVVLIADYPELVANAYAGDSQNSNANLIGWYKSSDSGGLTRDTAGPYFKLPDFRGYFVRSWTHGTAFPNRDTGRSYAGSSVLLAPCSEQEMSIGNHIHYCGIENDGTYTDAYQVPASGITVPSEYFWGPSGNLANPGNIGTTPQTGRQLRPIGYDFDVAGTVEGPVTLANTDSRTGYATASDENGYTASNGEEEIRPRNVNCNFCVRY
jgi:hypothetical protein